MTPGEAKANFVPLTPISFLVRAAKFFGERTAVIYEGQQYTYGELHARVGRLAVALKGAGIGKSDTVSVLAPNIPPMLEAHYAVPMIGAVLNPLNMRLESDTIATSLNHVDARLLICDREFLDLARQALTKSEKDIPLIVVNDAEAGLPRAPAITDYEDFINDAPDTETILELKDEFEPISILYTSGTTGTPKGVVYTHRGAYLAALSSALSFGLDQNSIHLWTWPMFHSNGLSFIWSVTAVGGTHVCLRAFEPAKIFDLIRRHRVSHFSAAPIVLNTLVNDQSADGISFDHSVNCVTGGAPPPSAVISSLEKLGIELIHQYGSTECYGPATIAWRRPEWDQLSIDNRAETMALQGTPAPVIDDLMVADPKSLQPVPRDGETLGEIMLRSNTVMQGYFRQEDESLDVMSGGWYHSGDIAVWHADGSIEIKDRAEDVIISNGKTISSVEIEEVLYKHPDVLDAAVVARPDDTLGEVPCAFVVPIGGADVTTDDLTDYCRSNLPAFKVPRHFIYGELPKTATGKVKKAELRELAKKADEFGGN